MAERGSFGSSQNCPRVDGVTADWGHCANGLWPGSVELHGGMADLGVSPGGFRCELSEVPSHGCVVGSLCSSVPVAGDRRGLCTGVKGCSSSSGLFRPRLGRIWGSKARSAMSSSRATPSRCGSPSGSGPFGICVQYSLGMFMRYSKNALTCIEFIHFCTSQIRTGIKLCEYGLLLISHHTVQLSVSSHPWTGLEAPPRAS